jgi:hypothetical protein
MRKYVTWNRKHRGIIDASTMRDAVARFSGMPITEVFYMYGAGHGQSDPAVYVAGGSTYYTYRK